MKKILVLFIVIIAIALGVNFYLEKTDVDNPVDGPSVGGDFLVGGDQDEHGCLSSAGYVWCEGKAECLRPFEDQWDDSCGVFPPPMNIGIGGDDVVACIEDAKVCSDGSVVVRLAPDCEFEECPDEISQ